MGISSKQVTMVTTQGEEWLHELCRIKLWLQILSWKPPSTNSHTNEDTNMYKNKSSRGYTYHFMCYLCLFLIHFNATTARSTTLPVKLLHQPMLNQLDHMTCLLPGNQSHQDGWVILWLCWVGEGCEGLQRSRADAGDRLLWEVGRQEIEGRARWTILGERKVAHCTNEWLIS